MSQAMKFHGREREIAWLRAQFDQVAAKSADGRSTGPRMAVVTAETGYGKSRIVQELYLRLSQDPVWDPPEHNYWPDAFRDVGAQLRVNPDMHGHVPQGPPRFLWLGMRWQPSDARNIDTRSALPELRDELLVHIRIVDQHRAVMERAVEAQRSLLGKRGLAKGVKEFAGVALEEVAGNFGIPFAGVALKILGKTTELVQDNLAGPRSHDSVRDEVASDLVDDLLECFDSVLHPPYARPVILWLDDAQWMDARTAAFLERAWAMGRRRRWPLLVVATHWEREWRERVQRATKDRSGTLAAWADNEGVQVWLLAKAAEHELAGMLHAALPGLTLSQRKLLLDKADGNFLTMRENVGELRGEPLNFVDGDPERELTPEGEEFVQSWESERAKRVEQRFRSLEPKVRNLLGWSSRLGVRFLHHVVSDFAARHASVGDGEAVFQWCEDPGAILAKPNRLTREFRDKAFHIVAARFFGTYMRKWEHELEAVLRARLAQWIDGSFDAAGELREGSEAGAQETAWQLRSGGETGELRDLLSMALSAGADDAGGLDARTRVRALVLAILNDHEARLWSDVRRHARALDAAAADSAPSAVVGVRLRCRLVTCLVAAGSHAEASRLNATLLDSARLVGPAERLCERLEWQVTCLGAQGRHAEASDSAREACELRRAACAVEASHLAKFALASALETHAGTLEHLWNLEAAEQVLREALVLRRELEPHTSGGSVALAAALRLAGDLAWWRDDLASAAAHYAEATQLYTSAATSGDEAARFGLWCVLHSGAEVAARTGTPERAQALGLEALALARELVEVYGRPTHLLALGQSLNVLGEICRSGGMAADALNWHTEALSVQRALVAELPSPSHWRAVSKSIDSLGLLAEKDLDLQHALRHYQDSLEISWRLWREWPNLNHANDLVWESVTVARLRLMAGRAADAAELLEVVEPVLVYLESELATDPHAGDTVAKFWQQRAECSFALGDRQASELHAAKVQEMRKRIAASGGDVA
jgi:tetratricopeptide (TPR) repeat protein